MNETADAFNKLSESFYKLGISAKEMVQSLRIYEFSRLFCPNKRVIHLSCFAKKRRVRKKNINRIYR